MITGIILVRNMAHLLARAITSLRRFDEVLVYDTMSADKSVEVAEMFGCKVIKKNFEVGFATMKNRAVEEAKNDNVFILDADEYINPDVYYELKEAFEKDPNVAFKFNRLNMYDLKNYIPEWYPDPQTRAYNRKVCKYEKEVHELLQSGSCKIKTSKFDIYHNLCDDRKRYIGNLLFYSIITKKELSRAAATEISQSNFNKSKKPVEEIERSKK